MFIMEFIHTIPLLTLIHLGTGRYIEMGETFEPRASDSTSQIGYAPKGFYELSHRLMELEIRNANLEQEVHRLTNLENFYNDDEGLNKEKTVNDEIDETHIKRKLAKRAASDTDPYAGIALSTFAFTAAITEPTYHLSHQGEAIIYRDVVTNVGGAYDNMTGVFTATVSGIYAFQFTTTMEPGDQEYLELVKNGINQVSTTVQGTFERRYESTSALTICIVQKGDKVWVRNFKDDQYGSGRIHGNGYTTFSGWLIGLI